jgi:hypothetical protein
MMDLASHNPRLDLIHAPILRCGVSGCEGGLQGWRGWLEGSFEVSAALRHLRMRARVGESSAVGARTR